MLLCRSIGLIFCTSAAITFPFRGDLCHGDFRRAPPSAQVKPFERVQALTPAQEYAGEILSHLLKIVLGKEGQPSLREAWRTTGLKAPLELREISDILSDIHKDQTRLLVMDPNLLALTEVLYYYDEKLSLYKGQYGFTGLYPSPEVMAIRLLLLQKIHRGEKILLQNLMDVLSLWTEKGIMPTPEDLKAAHLSQEEWKLIVDILDSEPRIYLYLESPFLVKALYEVGAVEWDAYVEEKIRNVGYQRYKYVFSPGSRTKDSVKIAFLPSVTKEFLYGKDPSDLSPYGFKPSPLLISTIRTLSEKIIKGVVALASGRGDPSLKKMLKSKVKIQDESEWENSIRERITFCSLPERPFLITPGNARKVTQEVSPDADFMIILLGKNIYLSIPVEEGTDTYPAVPWVYLDILDASSEGIAETVDQISLYVLARMERDLRHAVVGTPWTESFKKQEVRHLSHEQDP